MSDQNEVVENISSRNIDRYIESYLQRHELKPTPIDAAIDRLAATYAQQSALDRETMERCAKMQAYVFLLIEAPEAYKEPFKNKSLKSVIEAFWIQAAATEPAQKERADASR